MKLEAETRPPVYPGTEIPEREVDSPGRGPGLPATRGSRANLGDQVRLSGPNVSPYHIDLIGRVTWVTPATAEILLETGDIVVTGRWDVEHVPEGVWNHGNA